MSTTLTNTLRRALRVAGLNLGRRSAESAAPGERERAVWRRFGRNFTLGFAGSVVSSVIGLGRTGLLTKALTVEDFGRVLIVLNLVQFARVAISVRVNDVLYRFLPQFKEQDDRPALHGLVALCLALSVVTGGIVTGGMLLLGPFIANTFYRDPSLAGLFTAYAVAGIFLSLSEFSASILRLENQFSWVIIPQIVGNVIRVGALAAYLWAAESYQLHWVVAAFTLGVVVDEVPPLGRSLWLSRRYLQGWTLRGSWEGLRQHATELRSTLVQTSLAGYLQLTTNPGDQFLLGVLSSPEQVAIYGLAQQLIRPVKTVLRRNVNMAISPEMVSLWAQRRFRQLERTVWRIVLVGGALGGAALLVALPFARWAIVWVGKPRYLQSLPVLSIVSLDVVITLVVVPLYSVGLCMGLMKRRNTVLVFNALLLGLVALTGMTALKMALVQLAGVLAMVVFHDGVALRRLHVLTRPVSVEEAPVGSTADASQPPTETPAS